METPILDVCCGSKMFYFDKNNPQVTFMDCRELEDVLCDGRKLEIKPDIVGDFRNIPFTDNSFSMVVFDPPHLHRIGENSWMAKKIRKTVRYMERRYKQRFFRVFESIKA